MEVSHVLTMKKILIVTNSRDNTATYIVEKYKGYAEFIRFNVDDFSDYIVEICNWGWKLECEAWKVYDDQINSIYYRKPQLPNIESYDKTYHLMIARDIISVVNGMVDSFNGKVISKPCILRKTENKVYQMMNAMRNNLKMPMSYIGNSIDGCKKIEFAKIIKPITTAKLKTNLGVELYGTNIYKETNEDISLTPLYVQRYIKKKFEVRLTYVANKCFPVKIISKDEVDWRNDYSKHKYDIIDVPEVIDVKCKKILKDMALVFAAFDFIVDENGDWIFLEINPNGQWLWLEQSLNIPISRQIVGELLS